MKKRRIFESIGLVVTMLMLAVGLTQAQAPKPLTPQAAVGSAFTYQGYLDDSGSPANGTYDFQFILYDALSGGSQVGSTVTQDDVMVTDGIFTVALDFGQVFDGTGLWLEVAVRAGSSTEMHTILSPRQEITPAPYALYALNVAPHNHFGESWTGVITNGLEVQNTATSGLARGVYGIAESTTGRGVVGYASANTGATYGVVGWSDSFEGAGVQGVADAITGTTYGVYGNTKSTTGRGVYGRASATSGLTHGVSGRADSPEGRGVVGLSAAITGTNIGVYGGSNSPDGYGGYFDNTADGIALYATGDVAQDLAANGLVKAGAYVTFTVVGGMPPDIDCSIARAFTTVEGSTISTPVSLVCDIDFDFDLSQRYWVAMATDSGLIPTCELSSDTTLMCWVRDSDSLTNGNFMLLVY